MYTIYVLLVHSSPKYSVLLQEEPFSGYMVVENLKKAYDLRTAWNTKLWKVQFVV